MGSHIWYDRCPQCGFDEMVVQSYGPLYFEVACPMCGYETTPNVRIPTSSDLELVKQALVWMDASDKEGVVEAWWQDRISLVDRLRGRA